jgi:hypothetical protein
MNVNPVSTGYYEDSETRTSRGRVDLWDVIIMPAPWELTEKGQKKARVLAGFRNFKRSNSL